MDERISSVVSRELEWKSGLDRSSVEALKSFNQSIYPVRFPDWLYQYGLETAPKDFFRLVYHKGRLVGALCCVEEEGSRMYLAALGVAAAYRQLGIGSALLSHAIKVANERNHTRKKPTIRQLYLHVQAGNEQAISFYKNRGFEMGTLDKNYYKRLDPSDAWELFYTIHEKDP